MFKKLFVKNGKINVSRIILAVVMFGLVVFTVFHFSSHQLLVKSVVELFDSTVYYFKNIFSEDIIVKEKVAVLTFDEDIIRSVLPIDIEAFGYRFLSMFEIMVNQSFIKKSWSGFLLWLSKAANIFLLLAMPVFIFIIIYYNLIIFRDKKVSDPLEMSKPLKIYLWFKDKILAHVKLFILNLWQEFKTNKIFLIGYICLALYNINMFSFVLTFFAWYLYFVFSLDLGSLWVLVCKFFICISPLLYPFFWPFWIIGFIALIEFIKIKLGFKKLEDMYSKNDEFVDELGIITGIYGVPGSGKNLLEVAIATQKEKLLRVQAFNQLMEIRSEFPDFPFRSIERDVEDLKNNGNIVNKIQIEYHFRKLFKGKEEFYGYSLAENKKEHYDQLKVVGIVDELIDYAQLYYIFISSLAASTYSLRYDKGIKMSDAFPDLKYDFFHRDFRNDKQSENAKIFDLNLIRLNNQLDNENDATEGVFVPQKDKNITLFDFGILTLSEFGKDRGNRYSNQSRKDLKVKPSNDGTANCLGVLRHLTTVRYKQYGFIVWDEQKLSSFSGVEAAMAETNIFISKQNKTIKNALPLWFFEDIILEWFSSRYNKLYQKYIKMRNDQTLFSYIVSHVSAYFNNLGRKIMNTFGYRKLALSLSGVNVNGAQEQRGDDSFYLMNKIIFSDRYQTDCYKGFFDNLKRQAKQGINEFDSFSGKVATIQELVKTNGYFATELAQSIMEYLDQNSEAAKKELKKEEKPKEEKTIN